MSDNGKMLTVDEVFGAQAEPVHVAPGVPCTLSDVHRVFTRWLGEEYDLEALDAVLATAAAERLQGDPLWLLVISGSGNAKTETVQALAGAGAIVTSTISSEGALLSGSAKRERAKDATGGLLRRIGKRGLLVIKDVTTILAMNRDTRGTLLAAFREIHDGHWERNVGTDGGRTLIWTGRIVVIGAVTTAWDRAHDVIASMGDRFVVVRMDSNAGRLSAGKRACQNTGDEDRMRAELAAGVGGLLGTVHPPRAVRLTEEEQARLLEAANVVTLARTGVDYDYRGDVIDAHAPEMPTRFAKQLTQMVRGATAVGMDRAAALQLAIRCARDSMPPLRLAIFRDLAKHPGSQTRDVRSRLEKPRATVDRQLQSLHMLGVLTCQEDEAMHRGEPVTRWRYRLATGISPDVFPPDSVPEKSPHTGTGTKEESQGKTVSTRTDISGTEKQKELGERESKNVLRSDVRESSTHITGSQVPEVPEVPAVLETVPIQGSHSEESSTKPASDSGSHEHDGGERLKRWMDEHLGYLRQMGVEVPSDVTPAAVVDLINEQAAILAERESEDERAAGDF
jgi:hypothetical protein